MDWPPIPKSCDNRGLHFVEPPPPYPHLSDFVPRPARRGHPDSDYSVPGAAVPERCADDRAVGAGVFGGAVLDDAGVGGAFGSLWAAARAVGEPVRDGDRALYVRPGAELGIHVRGADFGRDYGRQYLRRAGLYCRYYAARGPGEELWAYWGGVWLGVHDGSGDWRFAVDDQLAGAGICGRRIGPGDDHAELLLSPGIIAFGKANEDAAAVEFAESVPGDRGGIGASELAVYAAGDVRAQLCL